MSVNIEQVYFSEFEAMQNYLLMSLFTSVACGFSGKWLYLTHFLCHQSPAWTSME